MDWTNERWVKLYTRDGGDLMAVGWQGRLIWYELLRKVDPAGILCAEPDLLPGLLRIPVEVFELGWPRMVQRGMVTIRDGRVIVPNFIEAQEARASDKQRQRESRARRRAAALAEASVTKRDATGSQAVTKPSHPVTSGHAKSRDEMKRDEMKRELSSSSAKPNIDPDLLNVLQYLMEESGRTFRPVEGHFKFMRARMREGATRADLKAVVWHRCHLWKGEAKTREWLRPKTLFNSENFDGYLSAAREAEQELSAEKKPARSPASRQGIKPLKSALSAFTEGGSE